jgi:hypothetical protein
MFLVGSVLLIFLAFCVVLFSFCLVCLRSVSYVTNVASVSGLSILYFAPSLFSYVDLCLDEYSTIIDRNNKHGLLCMRKRLFQSLLTYYSMS